MVTDGRPDLEALRSLDPLWDAAKDRLERRGFDRRGRLRIPWLPRSGRLALASMLERTPTATVDLEILEDRLNGLGVGTDLAAALSALGHPPSREPEQRRSERASATAAKQAARDLVGHWPEPWATEWVDQTIRSGALRGMTVDQAVGFMGDIRRVLDVLADRQGSLAATVSRTDLAAELLGQSHALDRDTRLGNTLERALALRADPQDNREPWTQAGVHLDLVSAPVLTWNLPAIPSSGGAGGIDRLIVESHRLSVPLQLNRYTLERHPVTVEEGSEILVVENPRVVEAAAQRNSTKAVIATNGNPSTAVRTLANQLLECGATLRYHGDFDAAGLGICARMHSLGMMPWRMDATDYLAAIEAAESSGVALPTDTTGPPVTPWDPVLKSVFAERRLVVHEERLLEQLLDR